MKILVTDDDPSLRLLSQMALRSAGHEVRLAEDGLQALECIRSEMFDLVLLDVSMPNMDGIEVLHQLKAEGITSLPVVLVSARVGVMDRLEGLEAGAMEYISKPFAPNELLALIEELRFMTEDKRNRYRSDVIERTRLGEQPVILDVDKVQQPVALSGRASLLDLAIDAIITIDQQQRIIGFNRGAQTVFGYVAEEVIGKPLEVLLPEGARAVHGRHVTSFISSDQPARLMDDRREIFGRRRDGTEFPAEASIVKQEIDGAMQLTAILRDVTEQRKAESELRRTALQQTAVARMAQAAVAGYTPLELMDDLAETMAEMLDIERIAVFEFEKGVLIARAVRGVPEHDMPQPMTLSPDVMAKLVASSGDVQSVEGDARLLGGNGHAPGSELWFAIPGPKTPLGVVAMQCASGVKLNSEDIHFLRAKNSILASAISRVHADERTRAYIEGAPDATIIVHENGEIVSANRQVESLFGYSRDELHGMNMDDLVPGSVASEHLPRRALAESESRRHAMAAGVDLHGHRKDGTDVPVDIMLNPLQTDDGPVVVVAIRDVTERRRVDAIRDAFLHAVSHELRTPLTSVIGFASLMRQPGGLENSEDCREMVEQIYSNGRRLEQLLDDILDLDRLSRGILEPNRHPIDLESLCGNVLTNAGLVGAPVIIDVAADARVANVDRAQVERIVENLVVNATRHCPPGTAIWIRATRGSNGVLLSVEDAGPGVPEHLKQTLFEPFRRGDRTGAVRGTGIGLSLVARFAELHGGRAWIDDREGGGAAFRVLLADATT
jgi:PAS domain S-box-containing protein